MPNNDGVKAHFESYQKLIRRSYDNKRIFSILSEAEKGGPISIMRAMDAGIPLSQIEGLPEYFTVEKRNFRMTRHGSNVFYGQLVTDNKVPVVPLREVPMEGGSYGNRVRGIDISND